jgi:hypothetical protein
LVEWLTPLKIKLVRNNHKWKPSCFIVNNVAQEFWALRWIWFSFYFFLSFYVHVIISKLHFAFSIVDHVISWNKNKLVGARDLRTLWSHLVPHPCPENHVPKKFQVLDHVKPPVWNPGLKIEIPHPENHVLKVFRFRSWKPRVWKSKPQSWDPKSWKTCPENHILKFPRSFWVLETQSANSRSPKTEDPTS